MATEALKIYGDRLSQPTRAVLIFCKYNNIDFEEVEIKIASDASKSPEFLAINPLGKVPAIAHGDFTLFESHAILTYLADCYKVPDHWYPADLRQKAKVQSMLDWHHTTLRYGSTRYLINTVLASFFGISSSPEIVAQYEKALVDALTTIENMWLKDDAKFLLGNHQISVADLSLVCEILELRMLPEEDWNRIVGPFTKVGEWIENVKAATNPHFDEFHQQLFDFVASAKQSS